MNKFKEIFDKIIKQDIGETEDVDSKKFWEDDGGTGEHDEESSEDKSKKRPPVKEKRDSKKDKTAASAATKEPIAKDKKKPVKAKAADEKSKSTDSSTEAAPTRKYGQLNKEELAIKNPEQIKKKIQQIDDLIAKARSGKSYKIKKEDGTEVKISSMRRKQDDWIARWNELTGKDWKKIKDAEEVEAKRTGPYKPNEYPRKVTRRRGLLKKDERRIIIRQLEHMSGKKNIDYDLEVAKRKIEKINQKLRRGETVTVEEREFIQALRNII